MTYTRRVSDVPGWDRLSPEQQQQVNELLRKREKDGIPGLSTEELEAATAHQDEGMAAALRFVQTALAENRKLGIRDALLPSLAGRGPAGTQTVAALEASDWKGTGALTSDRFANNAAIQAVAQGTAPELKEGASGRHITILRRALFDIHQAYSTHREAKQASMINQRISGSTFSLDPFGALMPTTRDHQPIRRYDAAMTETVRTFQKQWNAGAFRLLVGYSNETLKLDEHGRLGPKTLAALDMVAPPMGIYKADGYQFTRRSDEGTKRFISLSFDDGPHPTRTRRLLDLLAQRKLTATFYVTGNAGDNPALIRRIVDEGHRLGNHTKSHPPFGKRSSDQIRTELDAVQAMVNDALGRDYRIEWTRPPGGTRGYVRQRKVVNQGPSKGLSDIGQAHHADKVYKERGYRQMHWQIDSNDWPPGTKPESVVNTVMRHTRSHGGVILMHDVQQQTIDAMPTLLDRIEAHNRDEQRAYDLVITTGEELFNMKYPEEVADAAGHS